MARPRCRTSRCSRYRPPRTRTGGNCGTSQVAGASVPSGRGSRRGGGRGGEGAGEDGWADASGSGGDANGDNGNDEDVNDEDA